MSTSITKQAKETKPAGPRQAESRERGLLPLQPLSNLRREIDRLFDDFSGDFPLSPFRWRGFDFAPFRKLETFGDVEPRMDISETDKELRITAELAGMNEDDIEVSLSGDMLTIKGEKEEERKEEKADYHLMERHFGSFHRSFALPETVDPDKVDARFDKGILTITMPKTAPAKEETKKIKVKTKG